MECCKWCSAILGNIGKVAIVTMGAVLGGVVGGVTGELLVIGKRTGQTN
jgi:hypothetical protein